jgi:hypothetical protein
LSGEGEEEESDGGKGPLREVGACAPLTKSRGGSRGTGAWGGRGSAHRQAVYGGVVRATEALVRAVEASGSAAVATAAATTAPVEPSRNRKRGFSTLR